VFRMLDGNVIGLLVLNFVMMVCNRSLFTSFINASSLHSLIGKHE
jgi:hypothetical protein